MPYGLKARDIEHIISAIAQIDEIAEVVLFGSRAKGNYQTGSDIDLAIKGEGVTYRSVIQLSEKLNEETPLPYFFDIVDYEQLDNICLRSHIDRIGIVIFQICREGMSDDA
ncbi:MAG: nucleotidyltransferase domain-containing protein [Phormidesmis sp.]